MSKRFDAILESGKLPWIIIGYGIILRIVQYLYNPSLYIDEARDMVSGVLGRSFSDMLGAPPEIFMPSPPLAFMVIEKLAVQLMGNNEYALRLFPLIAGIVSLFLFFHVAGKYIKQGALIIALLLFATVEPLIYYSSSARPYSSDVMCTLLIYIIADRLYSGGLTAMRIFTAGVAGAIIIWFSSASVFVFAGTGSVIAVSALLKKDWSRVRGLVVVFALWLLSFGLYFFIYLKNFTGSQWFLKTFGGEDCFMPFPPLSFSDLKWYMNRFFETFTETAGFFLPGIAAALFIIGCMTVFKERKERFLVLISPAVFSLAASGFSLYPFRHRMILFLVPAILLIIAEGAEKLRDKAFIRTPAIGNVFIFLLLFHPLLSATHHLIQPILVEEIKPALGYLSEHRQEGDLVYVHYRAHPAFEYYAERYNFNSKNYIVGAYAGDKDDLWAFSLDYLKVYTDDLDKLRGRKRVWVLFIATPILRKGINEEVFYNYYLSLIGKQIDSYKSTGASVYLYDLSGEADLSSDRNGPREKRKLHWYF
ncbi:MAG: hypothetical protein C4560_06045 [Nitrospiraceae bacterium]|nr:MAG: hypothetical protein C4560_06045 [Nitrospiraceae bacterium]